MLFVQEKGNEPIKHKKGERIGQTASVIPEKRLPYSFERYCRPLEFTELPSGNFAEYINR